MITRAIEFYLLVALGVAVGAQAAQQEESPECKLGIAESVPDGLKLETVAGVVPTHETLVAMIDGARATIRIASFYLMLTPNSEQLRGHPSTEPGARIREALARAAERGVDIELVLDSSNKFSMSNAADIEFMKQRARVHMLDMRTIFGSGVMHSKFLVADERNFYVGSANFDWRSYTHVKEIGLTGHECPVMAHDLDKIFRTYVLMSEHARAPASATQDKSYKTTINKECPLETNNMRVFMGGAPPDYLASNVTGRTDDIEGLLQVIDTARESIDISVMSYSPRFLFGRQRGQYWPVIDDALRRAATERQVRVRMLISDWTSTRPLDYVWLRSLNALQSPALNGGGIHVKMFKVPAFDEYQRSVPYARVKHDKYMVTDNKLFVGTSNWGPEYFTTAAGVGVVMEPMGAEPSEIVKTMRDTFERDFNSEYAREL